MGVWSPCKKFNGQVNLWIPSKNDNVQLIIWSPCKKKTIKQLKLWRLLFTLIKFKYITDEEKHSIL